MHVQCLAKEVLLSTFSGAIIFIYFRGLKLNDSTVLWVSECVLFLR